MTIQNNSIHALSFITNILQMFVALQLALYHLEQFHQLAIEN